MATSFKPCTVGNTADDGIVAESDVSSKLIARLSTAAVTPNDVSLVPKSKRAFLKTQIIPSIIADDPYIMAENKVLLPPRKALEKPPALP